MNTGVLLHSEFTSVTEILLNALKLFSRLAALVAGGLCSVLLASSPTRNGACRLMSLPFLAFIWCTDNRQHLLQPTIKLSSLHRKFKINHRLIVNFRPQNSHCGSHTTHPARMNPHAYRRGNAEETLYFIAMRRKQATNTGWKSGFKMCIIPLSRGGGEVEKDFVAAAEPVSSGCKLLSTLSF